MSAPLYSIRMRASCGAAHISGAERIVPASRLAELSARLTERALGHAKGVPDAIRIAIEALDPATLVRLPLAAITTVRVDDAEAGRRAALSELAAAGVAHDVAARAVATLAAGVDLRGAMLVAARSGRRLDPVTGRGVRASRMDLAAETEAELRKLLAARGLDNDHVREALVLATKVQALPGFVAELCWSDDPDYSAGYVSTRRRGYVRYPHLKPTGVPYGGRVFFVDESAFDPTAALEWLERTPVLCDRVGAIHPDEAWPP